MSCLPVDDSRFAFRRVSRSGGRGWAGQLNIALGPLNYWEGLPSAQNVLVTC